MNVEIPTLTFVLEETVAYRNWVTRKATKPRLLSDKDSEPHRYEVVVMFGIHELALIPAVGNHTIVDKEQEQALIADTIMPFFERLFSPS